MQILMVLVLGLYFGFGCKDGCRGFLCHLEDFPTNLIQADQLISQDKGKFGGEGVCSLHTEATWFVPG